MGVSEACMELITSTSNLSPSQISMLVPGNIRLTAANVRLWPSAEIIEKLTVLYYSERLVHHDLI